MFDDDHASGFAGWGCLWICRVTANEGILAEPVCSQYVVTQALGFALFVWRGHLLRCQKQWVMKNEVVWNFTVPSRIGLHFLFFESGFGKNGECFRHDFESR
jgi:hypothetical protein